MDSTPAPAAAAAETPTTAPAFEDCLRLLRGERDEQKLAGLLVAANLCRAGDAASVVEVYRAVGPRFLRRLLNTGLGKVEGGKEEDREAYLRLSVTVLSGLARFPEVAADEGVVSTVPLIAEIVSKSSDLAITEECFELLSLIAIASDGGAHTFCEPGVMDMLFLQISNFPDGSRCLELAIHLMQLLVHKIRIDNMTVEKLQGMTSMVTSLARLFAVLHTTVKFEALHMLTALLSQKESPLHDALRSVPSMIWKCQIRVGITAVLQNRVVSSEKLQALLLAECMMSILGENWLSEEYKVPDDQNMMPVDKFVLLVLESARIEVSVLLNELAYLKYESSKNSQRDDAISQKERNLAILFSLIERIIKMISNASSGEGAVCQTIRESTIMKAITGLNETVGLVLDFLQDAKDHGQRKGDDLLAAVRIVGSYLAEAPYACKEKIRHLLEFIFSVEGQDESSSFHSICFMLPMLSQITMEADGCRILASFGGYKMVIDCLIKMIEQNGMMIDTGNMFLACDTIINFLSNMKNAHIQMGSCFVGLLKALVSWTGTADDSSVIITASCLCTLVLDLTTEEFLLSSSDFDSKTLEKLSKLIARSLHQGIPDDDIEQSNQKQIILSGKYYTLFNINWKKEKKSSHLICYRLQEVV
uniref:Neurochondrin n=1 Tax=Oryza nivara TaxID=4536 RepID=A0A0E0GE54_ORYNI